MSLSVPMPHIKVETAPTPSLLNNNEKPPFNPPGFHVYLFRELAKYLNLRELLALACTSKFFKSATEKGLTILTEVDCSTIPKFANNIVLFSRLKNLNTVDFSNCSSTGNPLLLGSLEAVDKLHTLVLKENTYGVNSLQALLQLSNLRSLDLSNSANLTAAFYTVLELTQLTQLKMSNAVIREDQLENLANLTALAVLDITRLRVQNHGGRFSKTVDNFDFLMALTQIEVLNLSNCIDSENCVIPSLEKLEKLYELNIRGNSIEDEGFWALNIPTQLKSLDLTDTRVSSSLQKKLKKNPQLLTLIYPESSEVLSE